MYSPSGSTSTKDYNRSELYRPYSKTRLERQDKTIQEVAGKHVVFSLGNMENVTDGSYLFLTMEQLKENTRAIQAILAKPTDIQIILDVEADSNGVLRLYSMVNTSTDPTELTLRRVFPWIQHLHLINSAKDITTIGQSFLYSDQYITDITFTGFSSVHTIESGFMLVCSKLKTADLSSLNHLKTVRDCFMSEASSLTHLSLPTSRFLNADLKTVGNHFLRGASSLTTIQEEAFESVTSMGGHFMSESALQSFNTAKFKDLRTLGAAFLAKCDKLKAVNVSGLKRITPALVTQADATTAAALETKGANHTVKRLEEAFRNGQRHNLGVMHGCDTLRNTLNGIRGVEHLPRALRVELADRFKRPHWVEVEAGCCGF